MKTLTKKNDEKTWSSITTNQGSVEHLDFLSNHEKDVFKTAFELDQKWNIENISQILLKKGFRMDKGYGKLRCRAFRIPHMGNIYMNDLEEYLNNFDEVLCQLKY